MIGRIREGLRRAAADPVGVALLAASVAVGAATGWIVVRLLALAGWLP